MSEIGGKSKMIIHSNNGLGMIVPSTREILEIYLSNKMTFSRQKQEGYVSYPYSI